MSPPARDCTKLWPPPLGQMTVMPFAMIVALLAIIAIAPPPPSFCNRIPFAVIEPPLLALNPAPLAVTDPFTVTRELVSELMPVPKPWAVTAAFVVTFAPFVAPTAVPKPTVTGGLTVQGAPPFCRMPPLVGFGVHWAWAGCGAPRITTQSKLIAGGKNARERVV